METKIKISVEEKSLVIFKNNSAKLLVDKKRSKKEFVILKGDGTTLVVKSGFSIDFGVTAEVDIVKEDDKIILKMRGEKILYVLPVNECWEVTELKKIEEGV